MKLEEKLYKQMLLRGLNQQRLATQSRVSDSEISRLLNAQAKRPGLYSVLRLARVLGVSLDYLADDSLEADPHQGGDDLSPDEREALDRIRAIGPRQALMLLDAAKILGPEMALRRLYGLDGRGESAPRPGPGTTEPA
jgi:transcriptional regulator with XRE-family HTH domain